MKTTVKNIARLTNSILVAATLLSFAACSAMDAVDAPFQEEENPGIESPRAGMVDLNVKIADTKVAFADNGNMSFNPNDSVGIFQAVNSVATKAFDAFEKIQVIKALIDESVSEIVPQVSPAFYATETGAYFTSYAPYNSINDASNGVIAVSLPSKQTQDGANCSHLSKTLLLTAKPIQVSEVKENDPLNFTYYSAYTTLKFTLNTTGEYYGYKVQNVRYSVEGANLAVEEGSMDITAFDNTVAVVKGSNAINIDVKNVNEFSATNNSLVVWAHCLPGTWANRQWVIELTNGTKTIAIPVSSSKTVTGNRHRILTTTIPLDNFEATVVANKWGLVITDQAEYFKTTSGFSGGEHTAIVYSFEYEDGEDVDQNYISRNCPSGLIRMYSRNSSNHINNYYDSLWYFNHASYKKEFGGCYDCGWDFAYLTTKMIYHPTTMDTETIDTIVEQIAQGKLRELVLVNMTDVSSIIKKAYSTYRKGRISYKTYCKITYGQE